jgi:hypothetical protein
MMRVRCRLLGDGAKPALLTMLEDAIQVDLIITEILQADGQPIKTDEHPLGATVHQRKLTNLITWPFTRMAPGPIRDLVMARVLRGPAPDYPRSSRTSGPAFSITSV